MNFVIVVVRVLTAWLNYVDAPRLKRRNERRNSFAEVLMAGKNLDDYQDIFPLQLLDMTDKEQRVSLYTFLSSNNVVMMFVVWITVSFVRPFAQDASSDPVLLVRGCFSTNHAPPRHETQRLWTGYWRRDHV